MHHKYTLILEISSFLRVLVIISQVCFLNGLGYGLMLGC